MHPGSCTGKSHGAQQRRACSLQYRVQLQMRPVPLDSKNRQLDAKPSGQERQGLGGLGESFKLRHFHRSTQSPAITRLLPCSTRIGCSCCRALSGRQPAQNTSAAGEALRECLTLCPEGALSYSCGWGGLVTYQGLSRHTKSIHVAGCLRLSGDI